MAKMWFWLLAACACVVNSSLGQDSDDFLPLFEYGDTQIGDDSIQSYETTEKVPLQFNISFFGSSYDAIYISKDGIVGFVEGIRYLPKVSWSVGIANKDFDRPFIAPFYNEGYLPLSPDEYQGNVFYRVVYADAMEAEDAKKSTHYEQNKKLLEDLNKNVQEAVINAPKDFKTEVAAVITWMDVTDKRSDEDSDCDPNEGVSSSNCKSATFQAVIIADKKNTFVMFNYLKMDIPSHETYQAGFNGGYERGWFNVIDCSSRCEVHGQDSSQSYLNALPNMKAAGLKGRYFLNVGGETLVRGGCVPTNMTAGMLEVYPREVGMLGGERLEVAGRCLDAGRTIYCRFGEGANVFHSTGVMTNDMRGFCPVPIMTIRGVVPLSWSSDNKDWSIRTYISIVVPWTVDDIDTNYPLEWQDPDTESLSVKWSPDRLSSDPDARVSIKLIGYRETNKVEFKDLKTLGDVRNSDGVFKFKADRHRCTENCEDFQMGLLEVSLHSAYYKVASHRLAFRYGPIPLGWYVNKQMTHSKGKNWPEQMCRQWYTEENKKDKSWLEDLPRCPCNLNQALADFGRWHAHPGCDLFQKTSCPFYSAKHCVRSLPQPKSSAGNICCYADDGSLMHTQLAFRGGAPMSHHPLGLYPYNSPGKVPSFSYMKNDAMPYMYCCYWQDLQGDMCHHYTKLRPTTDCVNYEVPGLAFIRGDPHITTFGGSSYQFGGKGDFILIEVPDHSIQGRFESRRESWDLGALSGSAKWKPTALTHLSIEGASQPVRINPAPEKSARKRGIDLVVAGERRFFYTKATKWQEFDGMVIVNNAISMEDNDHNNFTIITNNVGINVVALNNLLHVTVVLPPSMKQKGADAKGLGLLGSFDDSSDKGFLSKSNNRIILQANNSDAFFQNFGLSWAVPDGSSQFLTGQNTIRLNKNYRQYYSYDEIPDDFDAAPSESQINSTCDDDVYCKWDYRISGSMEVAKATKDANELISYTQASALKVESCGLPAIGDMAVLSSNDFSVGKSTEVTGCLADHKFEGQKTFNCIKERLADAKKEGRDGYGRVIKDESGVDFIVHWVPKPNTICEESPEDLNPGPVADDSSSDAGLSLGAIVGIIIAVVVVFAILLGICIYKKRKSEANDMENYREGTAEPMMESKSGSHGMRAV